MATRSAQHGRFPARYLYRRATARWRKLPDFLIIGTQKSGTSSLFHDLAQHPQVHAATHKEPQYFTHNLARGEAWYRSFFPLASSPGITGEATPYYLFSSDAAVAARALVPRARLIVIMRNPVDRAYSQYNMQARHGDLPSFEDAIGLNGDLTHEARRQFLARGRYIEHIEQWFVHFPRDQFAFVRAEDFFADPRPSLQRLYAFLGLPEVYPQKVERLVVGEYRDKMAVATRTWLNEYFAESNARLAALLGEEFLWR